jgi:AcrR family transcriptional regulator
LLDAAERAFGRSGVSATRIEDVAAEAGVATGLLYRHFSSKEELLDAVMQRRAGVFDDRLRSRLTNLTHEDPSVLVREGLHMWLEQITADVAAGRWITETEPLPCAAFREHTKSFVADQIRALAPTVDRELAHVVATMLEAVPEQAARDWHERGRPFNDQQLRDIVTAFCIAGLAGLARLLNIDIDLEVR